MKKSILPFFTGLVVFQMICIYETKSQEIEKPVKKFYLDLVAGATTDNGAYSGLGLQGILKNDWVASVSYHYVEMNPKNIPSDYEQGYTLLLIFPIYDAYPHVDMNIISFTGGKRFATGRKTWFTTEAGLSFISGQEFAFTKQPTERGTLWQSSNYSVTSENKTSIGGMLKADFNWAFTPYVGLGAGAFVNFSSIQTPVGGHIKLIIGWLNTKKNKV